MEDDLLEQYRIEAAAAMEKESMKRIAETVDVEKEALLKSSSLHDVEDLVGALLARLGSVRAALDGHGGGISVESQEKDDDGLSYVLDLTELVLLWCRTRNSRRHQKRPRRRRGDRID